MQLKTKNSKHLFLIIALLSFAFADNEFIIESFKALPNDMAGSVYARKDGNNEFCGLIKVKTGIREELAFDSGLKFSPSEKKKPGEYWVYVSPGEGRLTLFAESFVPKHFQISTVKIESKRTYELVVRAKEEEKIPVSILSEPSDAEKMLDGISLGTGDNFQVIPGNYLLTVRKQGYKDYTRQIQVDKDNALFKDIVLNRIEPLEIQISSNPPGADIFIDDIQYGQTNMGLYLYEGNYDLKLILSGHIGVTEKIKISEKSENRFFYSLVRNTGVLKFNFSPADVKILVNKINFTGRNELSLGPGTYMIEISKPGYYDKSEVVELKRGETKTVSLELEQKTGRLQVSISPLKANCILKKDGKEILKWAGMQDIKDLLIGEYELSCYLNEHITENRKIVVEENTVSSNIISLKKEKPTTYTDNNVSDEKITRINQYGVEEIYVYGGTFRMGDIWGDGEDDEKAIYRATISDYYISKYEITQRLYKKIMNENPSYFIGEKYPVEQVTWHDAIMFCNTLSEIVGLQKVYTISGTNVTADFTKNGFRLPTEAEWEYAARSRGSEDQKWSGTDNINLLTNYAWYDSNSGNKTHPVGTKQPNDLGIYDMSGNVWEWCWDYSWNYPSIAEKNPRGPSTGFQRITRGGSWDYIEFHCRTANRSYHFPSRSRKNLGFRIVRNGE